jgi:NDP-sugar pyrophosphorylase family protein
MKGTAASPGLIFSFFAEESHGRKDHFREKMERREFGVKRINAEIFGTRISVLKREFPRPSSLKDQLKPSVSAR